MPLRRKRRRKSPARRRRYPRRRRRRITRYRRRRLPLLTGFGNKKLARLRYVEARAIDPISGGISTLSYSANGLYDPYLGTGGHQPRGFDQWMLTYQDYTVIGSKMWMQPLVGSVGNAVPGAFGIIKSNETSFPFSDVTDVMESKRNKGIRLQIAGSNNIGPTRRAMATYSHRKHFGTKRSISSADFTGTATSNPATTVWYYPWYASIGGSDPSGLSFLFTIDYIGVFTNAKSLDAS